MSRPGCLDEDISMKRWEATTSQPNTNSGKIGDNVLEAKQQENPDLYPSFLLKPKRGKRLCDIHNLVVSLLLVTV